MPLHANTRDAVSNANLKTVAEGPAFYTGLAMGDAVAHQRSTNALREAATAVVVKNFADIEPVEAMSVVKVMQGDEQAQQAAALGAMVAQVQQVIKGAQTTPPVTP